MQQERRKKRSFNIHEALELQLSACAERASFSALMLTENKGIPVAGAGDVDQIEDIAAFAPQLAFKKRVWQGKMKDKNGHDQLVTVAPLNSVYGNLYMCAAGGESAQILAELLIGGKGVKRILN
jgi:hypothetical protein